ncbi:YicC/YloC family endoribonuclease [Fretibacter rubidus]|uniref:YicC/YloC family endoribonuclease n=1 Tax=Fretibacter rubidus TaxID=570162 RepID=UPI00352AC440
MALSGMTGFARVSGTYAGHSWQWEVRSVNGRTLDLRVKLPSEVSAIEPTVKKAFSDIFTRGNMQISLSLNADDKGGTVAINEALFDTLARFVEAKGGNSNLAVLMTIDGVVTQGRGSTDEVAQEGLEAALIQGATEVATTLKQARDDEGAALLPLFETAVSALEKLTIEAAEAAATQPKSVADRLSDQVKDLAVDIDPDRLAAEIALLATKADVREELDRLTAHSEQARALLSQGSPIGRKLEFLSQEFNRETNTLCAKSSDITLTRIGLSMKSVIEQFREQAANVE